VAANINSWVELRTEVPTNSMYHLAHPMEVKTVGRRTALRVR